MIARQPDASSHAPRSARPTTRAASRSRASWFRSSGTSRVTLEGQDVEGDDLRLELEGLPARVAQHELDHLDGVLILDRTTPEARREALGHAAPAADPRFASAARRRGDGAVRRRRARAARGAARDRVPAHAARPAAGPRAQGRAAAGEGGGRAARDPGAAAERLDGFDPERRHDRRRRLRRADPGDAARPARSGSTSTRRCCRAGAARRRSSARSWPATRRPA